MKHLLFCLFLFGSLADLSAQTGRQETPVNATAVARQKFSNYVTLLRQALDNGNTKAAQHYQDKAMLCIRSVIEDSEVSAAKGQADPSVLERQKAILTALEGFSFAQSNTKDASPKFALLEEFGQTFAK